MRDSKARLVNTAIVAASRFPFPRLYRSPGTPIGKSIDYLDFATIELPGPAYILLTFTRPDSARNAIKCGLSQLNGLLLAGSDHACDG
jgi:hypothetical protein